MQVSAADAKRYGGSAHTIEKLLEASVRFLLEREPDTSILGEFDLSVSSRYFPEYERAIGDYLEK